MMWGYGTWPPGWAGVLMAIGMVLFWALIILGLAAVIHWLRREYPGQRPAHLPTPEQILAERFARGDIEEKEYRDRLAALRSESRPVG